MTLQEIRDILGARSAWELGSADWWEREVHSCQASDLMSDVLDFRKSGSLLLTGLCNAQVVRTAEVADLAAICLVRGKQPDEEMTRLAEEKGIPLLLTEMTMFQASGELYAKGLSSASDKDGTDSC